jgi:hypothetical protein
MDASPKKPLSKPLLLALLVIVILSVWSMLDKPKTVVLPKNNKIKANVLNKESTTTANSTNSTEELLPALETTRVPVGAVYTDLFEVKPTPEMLAAQAAAKAAANAAKLAALAAKNAPPPAPPPPPVAPPLTFEYLGRLYDGDGVQIYLAYQGTNFVLSSGKARSGLFTKGDVILNTYRVMSVSSNAVKLMYLPLNQEQTLPIGG